MGFWQNGLGPAERDWTFWMSSWFVQEGNGGLPRAGVGGVAPRSKRSHFFA